MLEKFRAAVLSRLYVPLADACLWLLFFTVRDATFSLFAATCIHFGLSFSIFRGYLVRIVGVCAIFS